MSTECVIIADDLTGACDASVHFAVRGYRTVVRLHGATDAEVVAVSTESRDLPPHAIGEAMRSGVAELPVHSAGILFKKIDSTLRGNAGVEIAEAMAALECDTAVITPAFPAMERTVVDGILRVTLSEFEPVDVSEYLCGQGLAGCRHTRSESVSAELASGARYVSVDADSDEHLDVIVAAGLRSGRRILWAGSAGLASALARTLTLRDPLPGSGFRRRNGAVLFCIGSDHSVTLEQQRTLIACRDALLLTAETATRDCIRSALERGRPVVLRIPRGQVREAVLLELLEGLQDSIGALVLSGGDTASFVVRALAVESIVIIEEIGPGIPLGMLAGGMFAGSPVVTKSGGFGGSHALIEIADFFTCRN